MVILPLYQILTTLLVPLLKIHLKRRISQGKEDPGRLSERWGRGSAPRPAGPLIWMHGASVGESLSLLPLMEALQRESNSSLSFLITTSTVTSARCMKERLPPGAIHQFLPLDVPSWMDRFFHHWRPDLGLVVESEWWPNMLHQASRHAVPMIMLNGRLSKATQKKWSHFPRFLQHFLSFFQRAFISDPSTLGFLERILGANSKDLSASYPRLSSMINLKLYTSSPPSSSTKPLSSLGDRRLWAAVSTHEGEEEIILRLHHRLKKIFPGLLTFLAPRHPHRCAAITQQARDQGLIVTHHSGHLWPEKAEQTDIWMMDTIGDLDFIYGLAPITFVGGSLVSVGGHNPLEPLRAGSFPVLGPHTHNFEDILSFLKEKCSQSWKQVADEEALYTALASLLKTIPAIQEWVQQGQDCLRQTQHTLPSLAQTLLAFLRPEEESQKKQAHLCSPPR